MNERDEAARITALQFKVGQLERKLNFVMTQLHLEYVEEQVGPDMTEVANWLKKGNKMEAIKVYRQMTGLGLKEAMAAVDAYALNLGIG